MAGGHRLPFRHPAIQRERHRSGQPEARRSTVSQSVVPPLAVLRCVLPTCRSRPRLTGIRQLASVLLGIPYILAISCVAAQRKRRSFYGSAFAFIRGCEFSRLAELLSASDRLQHFRGYADLVGCRLAAVTCFHLLRCDFGSGAAHVPITGTQ
jgi:hypothetical protein